MGPTNGELSPATHYAIEVVKGDISSVGHRVDKIEESQARHRNLFAEIARDITAFKAQVAEESGTTKTILKFIAVAASIMATGVVSIAGMMIYDIAKAHFR